jgi:signal transduction histidine kinase
VRIGQRLLLAVTPGIVGVLAVAGLAYWGERGRQVPALLVAIVAIVTLLSLWFAWVTTRDLARRIERLGRLVDAHQAHGPANEPTLLVALARETVSRLSGSGKAGADELDAVERLLARFDGELARFAEKERAADLHLAGVRAETSQLLHDAGDRIARRMDDVRLPLHVLLEAPFGELNENQEELLGVARTAADEASAEARKLRELGALELSAGARRDRLSAAELLRALQPLLQAEGRRAHVGVALDVPPALPAIVGDRSRLQEAVREVLALVVRAAPADSSVRVTATADPGAVRVVVSPVRNVTPDELSAEHRLLKALGGDLSLRSGVAEISLPLWR